MLKRLGRKKSLPMEKLGNGLKDERGEKVTFVELSRNVHDNLKSMVLHISTLHNTREYFQGPVQLTRVRSHEGRSSENCLSFSIPYSNTSFNVELVLSTTSPRQIPDIIPEDDRFFDDNRATFVNIQEHLPALCHWSLTEQSLLSDIIEQLVRWYQDVQVSLLPPGSKMKKEYEALLNNLDIPWQSVKVFCAKSADNYSGISVRLDVDPPALLRLGENPNFYLIFQFSSFAHVADISLQMPESGGSLIGPEMEYHIPRSGQPISSCVEVVCDIKEKLQQQLNSLEAEVRRGQELLCCMVAANWKLVSYDSDLFEKVEFLYRSRGRPLSVKLHWLLRKQKITLFLKLIPHVAWDSSAAVNAALKSKNGQRVSFEVQEDIEAIDIMGKIESILHNL